MPIHGYAGPGYTNAALGITGYCAVLDPLGISGQDLRSIYVYLTGASGAGQARAGLYSGTGGSYSLVEDLGVITVAADAWNRWPSSTTPSLSSTDDLLIVVESGNGSSIGVPRTATYPIGDVVEWATGPSGSDNDHSTALSSTSDDGLGQSEGTLAFIEYGDSTPGGYPEVRSRASSTSGSGQSHDVQLPPAIVSGDLIVIFFGCDGEYTGLAPSGWSTACEYGTDGGCTGGFYYKTAVGDEGGTTVTFSTSSNEYACHRSWSITAGTWNDIEGVAVGGSTSSSIYVAEAGSGILEPSWGSAKNLWIGGGTHDTDDAITASPSSPWGQLWNDAVGGNSGVRCAIAEAEYETGSSANIVDNYTLDASDGYNFVYIVIEPYSPQYNGAGAGTLPAITGVATGTYSSGPAQVTHGSYRGRADDGDEDEASWLAAVDTPFNQQIGEPFRVRTLLQNLGGETQTQAYKWQYLDDFGELTRLSNPTAPDGPPGGLAINAQGSHMAVTLYNTSPYLQLYSISGETFTQLTDPSGASQYSKMCQWDETGRYLAVGIIGSPYLEVWRRDGDSLTKLTLPSWGSVPPVEVRGLSWYGNYLAIGTSRVTDPRFLVLKRSGDTFTLLDDPADSYPSVGVDGVYFAPNGDYLVAACYFSPYSIYLYSRSGDVFTLEDSTLGSGMTQGLEDYRAAWDPTSTYFAAVVNTATTLTLWKRSGSTMTKLSVPTITPTGAPLMNVAWDPTGRLLFISHQGLGYITPFYLRDDVLTKGYLPDTYPTDEPVAMAVTPDLGVLAVVWFSGDTQYLGLYRNGTWTDVYAQATGSVPVRFADSSYLTDGEATTEQMGGSGVFVAGEINESNPTGSVQLDEGDDTEFEGVFELVAGEAEEGAEYMFRLVVSTGEALDLYRKIAQGTAMTAIVGHMAYRGREDDGDEDEASWISGAPVNTPFDQAIGQTFRVRVLVEAELVKLKTAVAWQYSDDQLSLTKLTNPPAVAYAGYPAWDPTGEFLACPTGASSPYISVYQRVGDTMSLISLTGGYNMTNWTASWTPDGRYFCVSGSGGLVFFERRKNKIERVKLLTSAGSVRCCAYTDGFLAVSYDQSPYVVWWQHDGGLGYTQMSSPATLPNGVSRWVDWDPTGEFLALSLYSSPWLNWYQRSGTTLTKLTSPSGLSGQSECCRWDPSGTYLAVLSSVSPYLYLYKRSGTTLTLQTAPDEALSGFGIHCAWDPTGEFLAVGVYSASPYMEWYRLVDDQFIKLDDPASAPDGSGWGVAWTPSGTHLAVAVQTSPYVNLYRHGSWQDVFAQATESVPIRFADSEYITDHEVTTKQLGSGTFVAGEMNESNPSNDVSIGVGEETEFEAVLELVSGQVSPGTEYWIRLVVEDGS